MTGISLFLFDWMEVNVLIDECGVNVETADLDKVVDHRQTTGEVFELSENKAVILDGTP